MWPTFSVYNLPCSNYHHLGVNGNFNISGVILQYRSVAALAVSWQTCLYILVCYLQKRRVHLTPEQASDFYAEHYGKLFFPSLVAYMSSGPVISLVLAREKAISYWRELIGPTNAIKARETHPDWYVNTFIIQSITWVLDIQKWIQFQYEKYDFSCISELMYLVLAYISVSFLVAIICFVFLFSSLRAIYGTDDQRNGLHGSDSYSSVEREIRFFFPDSIVEPIPVGQAARDYLAKAVNPTLLKGLTQLCKRKPSDPVVCITMIYSYHLKKHSVTSIITIFSC